jgi:hypothetical protein
MFLVLCGIGVGMAGLRDAWEARRPSRVKSADGAAALQIR